jgi:hypothetical protein
MEAWRDCWRKGVAPLLSTRGLEALRQALVEDDPSLLQGETTRPLALTPDYSETPKGACAMGYSAWKGDGLATVREVELFFQHACREVDQLMGWPGASQQFIDWFDLAARDEMRCELLIEVSRALAQRLGGEGDGPDAPLVVEVPS